MLEHISLQQKVAPEKKGKKNVSEIVLTNCEKKSKRLEQQKI